MPTYLFSTLDEVRELTYRWLTEYNKERPHSKTERRSNASLITPEVPATSCLLDGGLTTGSRSVLIKADSTLAFSCSKSGLCCQHVDLAPETRHLDRGDGSCEYYEWKTKGCSIYAARPDIDNMQCDMPTSTHGSPTLHVALNSQACAELQVLHLESE